MGRPARSKFRARQGLKVAMPSPGIELIPPDCRPIGHIEDQISG
jgi:hypothetical protein